MTKRALLCTLPLLAGFSSGGSFDHDPIKQDGSAKIAFTGSPRFTGHTCDVCHTDAPHTVGLQVQADDESLFTDGWTANKQYHLRVVLLNEHAAAQYQSLGDNCGDPDAYKPCDNNGFAFEVDTSDATPVGKFVPVAANACANSGTIPVDVDSQVISDGTAVAHTGSHKGQLAWDFCWTAPAAGTGTLTAYVAAVDGNGGDGTAAFPFDTTGDDVATGQLLLAEQGAGPPPTQGGGCSAGGEAGIAVAVALLLLRRRRLPVLLACAALAGCVHVRPTQRETLAKRNMKFGPDPIEDELDLHMQESREGAAGGYGSSGGGCGCN